MAIRYYYMNPTALPVELTSRVWTALEWNASAEEMNAVQSEWVIEDPESDLLLYPWRRVYVVDDAAPVGRTVIGMGFIADIHMKRSEVYGRTPTSRAWHLTITDLNYNATRHLLDADDTAARPDETDLARLAWLLATNDVQSSGMGDSTDFQDTTGAVTLDAYDFISSSTYDVLRGMMDQSGRNAFVLYDESKGPPDFNVPALGELAIWYAKLSSDLWAASVALSNDPADIDPSTGTFALAEEDLDLHPDPSRIYSRLYGAYDGGLADSGVEVSVASIYTVRESVVQMADLKTSAKAELRLARMLEEGAMPATRLQWGYHCTADYVNGLLAGQSFAYRATHLGGLTAFGMPNFAQAGGAQVRAMDRTVREEAPGQYYVSGTAVPTGVALPFVCEGGAYAVTPSQIFLPNFGGGSDADGLVWYSQAAVPTIDPHPNLANLWGFPVYNSGGSDFAGDCTLSALYFFLVGPGTLTVQSSVYAATPRGMLYSIFHSQSGVTMQYGTTAFTSGDSVAITVASHANDDNCAHVVRIVDDNSACGGKWGWSGANWVSNNTDEVSPDVPPPVTPAEPSGPHWTTAFMARTPSGALSLTSNAQVAAVATSGTGTALSPYVISGKEFDALGANVIAIRLANISAHVLIEDCDFRDVAECIYAVDCTGSIKVGWCRYKNITGPNERVGLNRANFIQVNNCTGGGRIYNNKGREGDTEDIISLYKSSGFIVEDNHFEGTTWDSASGSGIAIGDDGGSNNIARNNILVNPGQVGIFIAGGTNNSIVDNIIIGEQRTNSNVGMYVWNQYVYACAAHTVDGNQVEWLNAAGVSNGFWNHGNCGTVTGTNTLNAALDIELYRVVL